jgi:uncharacterized HhH-GPD family protein
VAELHLSQDPEADRLLSESPLALLIGMVLDQQVPLEWAFAGPAELERRLGRPLDARVIAEIDPESLVHAFADKPALHRYPASMAARVQELCRLITDRYGGEADRIWADVPSARELLTRIKELPGFGDHKAKIFVALLGKQLGVQPEGWEKVSAPFGDEGSFRSVADITDGDTLVRVRAFKQSLKTAHKEQAAAKAQSSGKAHSAGEAQSSAEAQSSGRARSSSSARPPARKH